MKSILSVLLVSLLLLTSCTSTTSNLITALNAVSEASSVAVVVTQSLVALGKVDQGTATQVSAYATGVSAAVTTSVAELNGTDTNPVKIANITAAFAKIATPAFGSQSPAISAAISAVSAAIDIFLNQLGPTTVTAKLAVAAPKASVSLTSGDKKMLKQIMKKNAEVQVGAQKLAEK